MSFDTVPVCDECWRAREGEREPHRFKQPLEETCHWCNKPTRSGIYVRECLE